MVQSTATSEGGSSRIIEFGKLGLIAYALYLVLGHVLSLLLILGGQYDVTVRNSLLYRECEMRYSSSFGEFVESTLLPIQLTRGDFSKPKAETNGLGINLCGHGVSQTVGGGKSQTVGGDKSSGPVQGFGGGASQGFSSPSGTSNPSAPSGTSNPSK
jgi:hypothetical protein